MRSDPLIATLGALRGGRPAVLLDDTRAGAASLMLAASNCSRSRLAFAIRYGSGFVRAALPAAKCDMLELPSLRTFESAPDSPDFCVSVDASHGVTTGISAADRALTLRLLGAGHAQPGDFSRPGHVVPERVDKGGVLKAPRSVEAAVDLARLAGLGPAAAISELVSTDDERQVADTDEAAEFARAHRLPLVTVSDVVRYRRRFDVSVEHVDHYVTTLEGFRVTADGFRVVPSEEDLTVLTYNLGGGSPRQHVPVAVLRLCAASRRFPGATCSCADRLAATMSRIAVLGGGAIVLDDQKPTNMASGSCVIGETSGLRESCDRWSSETGGGAEELADQISTATGPIQMIFEELGIRSGHLLDGYSVWKFAGAVAGS